MTSRQFIGLLAVIAFFVLIWWLDSGRDDRNASPETGMPVFVFHKPDPESVIRITNEYRAAKGLPPLKANPQLNLAAQMRAEDMIAKKYFAHNCPSTGDGFVEAAQSAGYQHMMIAENIAKGSFSSSQKMVTGWMNSKGHRENILNPDMREIGAAVVRDRSILPENFRPTYYGVQLFAVKKPDCIAPDKRLKDRIEVMQNQHKQMQMQTSGISRQLESIKNKIKRETDPARASGLIDRYNLNVSGYNFAVEELRRSSDELNKLIKTYNTQVNSYQACMSAY